MSAPPTLESPIPAERTDPAAELARFLKQFPAARLMAQTDQSFAARMGALWLRTIDLGIKNLLLHKLRSTLTVLGVILGVGSVIAMLAIGEGSKREALEQIRQLGATNIIISSIKPGSKGETDDNSAVNQSNISWVIEYGLKFEDFERLRATLPTIRRALPISLARRNAQHEHRIIPNARILGTTPQCAQVKNLRVARGRFLTAPDIANEANVAVLGAGAANKLFSYEDPLRRTIHLGDDAYRVVGVLEEQGHGGSAGGTSQQDFNRDIYIPLSAVRARMGELQMVRSAGSRSYERTQLSEITLTVNDIELVGQTAAMARAVLLRSHPKADDFEIQVPLERLRQAEREKRIWNLVLGSIAGISLVVGGIGIMNIMLASVTERTREIGIRRALGAKCRDITIQFLVETVVLSLAGGLIGIVVGVTIPLLVSQLFEIETFVSWWSIVLALVISAGIGIAFGMYPARRAALMDPIEALRQG